MSFQKAGSLQSLVDQYVKSFDEIKKSISNIPDEKTLKQIRTNFTILTNNAPKIEKLLDEGTDPNLDELQEQYNNASMDFDTKKNSWDSILKKEEAKYEEIHKREAEQKAMENLSEEQLQVMQQSDELEYIGRQAEEINKMAKDLNEITHKVDDKITEDHEKVVKIDEHIETAKNEMVEGNKDLDHAEKDQKKCNIC